MRAIALASSRAEARRRDRPQQPGRRGVVARNRQDGEGAEAGRPTGLTCASSAARPGTSSPQKVLEDREGAERDPARQLACRARGRRGRRSGWGLSSFQRARWSARAARRARDRARTGSLRRLGRQNRGEREQHLAEVRLVAARESRHDELFGRPRGERGRQLDLEETRREEGNGPDHALRPGVRRESSAKSRRSFSVRPRPWRARAARTSRPPGGRACRVPIPTRARTLRAARNSGASRSRFLRRSIATRTFSHRARRTSPA